MFMFRYVCRLKLYYIWSYKENNQFKSSCNSHLLSNFVSLSVARWRKQRRRWCQGLPRLHLDVGRLATNIESSLRPPLTENHVATHAQLFVCSRINWRRNGRANEGAALVVLRSWALICHGWSTTFTVFQRYVYNIYAHRTHGLSCVFLPDVVHY